MVQTGFYIGEKDWWIMASLGVKEKEDKSWYTTGLKDVSKLKKDFWDTIHNSRKVNICLLMISLA